VHAPVSKKLNRHGDQPLHVLCPITKDPILTRIATDVRSLSKAWHSNIRVSCPHCNMTHKYRVSEAFTEAAISDELMRGSAIQMGLDRPRGTKRAIWLGGCRSL
jgi:hypothetical protein